MQFAYLVLLGISISFPLAASFEKRVHFVSKWPALFPAMIMTASIFIIWDILFTQNGVWGFNRAYTLGLHIFSLPVEEWLFFIVIPFSTVFIYECVAYFFPGITTSMKLKVGWIVVALALLTLALMHVDKKYTFYNFLFSGVFVLGAAFRNPLWLGKFTIAYGFHLLPFFLVNGILTGSFLSEPIVWYNDKENLGIRLGTIPIEDTIYSLLLLFMNVWFFEYFKKKQLSKT